MASKYDDGIKMPVKGKVKPGTKRRITETDDSVKLPAIKGRTKKK